ncbi:Hypothetical protein SMAX5B_020571 [Scophthalmus maximus]|uniref:Uncharacterized protein n=1 Tax=Scophthalmus maximus TaxID=52904 RepID=A0A2U9CQF1_SCOMX|nr:Hypothetical protein SMAX5B_020571 [Scophthalmus maximus]
MSAACVPCRSRLLRLTSRKPRATCLNRAREQQTQRPPQRQNAGGICCRGRDEQQSSSELRGLAASHVQRHEKAPGEPLNMTCDLTAFRPTAHRSSFEVHDQGQRVTMMRCRSDNANSHTTLRRIVRVGFGVGHFGSRERSSNHM